jgi:Tol biopolymer transport system component
MSVALRRRATLSVAVCLGVGQSGCSGIADSLSPAHESTIVVVIEGQGSGKDADGFTATLDAQRATPLTYGVPVRYDGVPPGTRVIRLSGVAAHCATDRDSVLLSGVAGAVDTAVFRVACVGGIAFHELTAPAEYQIRYLREDGQLLALTNGPGRRFIKEWSPDGSRLLFSNDADGHDHLFSVQSDGSDLRQLTSGAVEDIRPRYSPDGRRIAFWRLDRARNRGWITVMDADGSNSHALYDVDGFDFDPEWSRDGSLLYFSCDRFRSFNNLCIAAPDGSGLRRVHFPEMSAIEAECGPICIGATPQHWLLSPDGRSIAFVTMVSASHGGQAAWVGSIDGSSARMLTPGLAAYDASWSPKGDALLVSVSDGALHVGLATAKADGSGFQLITSFTNQDESAQFSPDATMIAFDGFQSGDQRLWWMNGNGAIRRQWAPGGTAKFLPRWHPNARPGGVFSSVPFPDEAPSVLARQSTRAVDPAGSTRGELTPLRGTCLVVRTGASSRVECGRPAERE